jgi:uncharacterized membrane protein
MANSVAVQAQRRAASSLRQSQTIRASGVPRQTLSKEPRTPRCQGDGETNIAVVKRVLHVLGFALIACGVIAPNVLAALAPVWPRTATLGWLGGACLFGWWIPIAFGAAIIRLIQR